LNRTAQDPNLLLIGAAVFLVLVVVGIWYRTLGPGSVPPAPTRVEADDGGVSPKARQLMQYGR
jgi:hypothetical protein